VRVLDEERSSGKRTGCFVVEATSTRERWPAGKEDLLDRREASVPLEDASRERVLRIAQDALFLANAGIGTAGAATVLRSVADRLDSAGGGERRNEVLGRDTADVLDDRPGLGDGQVDDFDYERGAR
jgi:hypothetical protein